MPEVEDGIAAVGDESAAGSSPVIEGAEEHEEHKQSKRSQKVKQLAEKLTEAEQKIAFLERQQGGRAEQPQQADP